MSSSSFYYITCYTFQNDIQENLVLFLIQTIRAQLNYNIMFHGNDLFRFNN